jgi:hypothetical protein
MRVPRTHGLPNLTSGVIVMRSRELMRSVYGNSRAGSKTPSQFVSPNSSARLVMDLRGPCPSRASSTCGCTAERSVPWRGQDKWPQRTGGQRLRRRPGRNHPRSAASIETAEWHTGPFRTASQHDQSDASPPQVLLVPNPPIGREQQLETCLFGSNQQSAVAERGPAFGLCGMDGVPRQLANQPLRRPVVKENEHRWEWPLRAGSPRRNRARR